MPSDLGDSVTAWIARLRAGDHAAVVPLWDRYFAPLVRQAGQRIPPGGDADGEDIAASAFKSFWAAAVRGRFPDLNDRHDLWRSLQFVLNQKVADELRRRNARKRGGGSTLDPWVHLDEQTGPEPDPHILAAVNEEFRRLLDLLGDDQLRQVALWKLDGDTHQEIAARLGCVPRTVVNKVNLIRKLWEREAPRCPN